MKSRWTGPRPAPGQLQRPDVRFAGYAAVFDRPDNGGDVVRAGAFAASLARLREVPLLWRQLISADFLSRDEKRRQLGFDLEDKE